MTKLHTEVEKCYAKGVRNFARGAATGIVACIDDPARGALAKYAATIASLTAKPGSLPICASFELKGPLVAAQTRAQHAYAYCGPPPGSPSGAFLEGSLTY